MTPDRAPAIGDALPAPFWGLWSREVIFTPAGYRDETTKVAWLQTRAFYGDLRIPADRPSRPGATDFDAFTDAEIIGLARVQGFAGVLTAREGTTGEGVCLWRRDLDYHPPSATPDEARYAFDGDTMAEYGIHAEYTEIWRRAPASETPLVALRRDGAAPGLLVIAGDHFLEVQGRAEPLPDGESLAAIVERDLAEGRGDRARARLLMRICLGRIAGAQSPWRIERSTLPWLEGAALFAGEGAGFDPARGRLTRGGGEVWRVEDSTIPFPALDALLAPALNPGPP